MCRNQLLRPIPKQSKHFQPNAVKIIEQLQKQPLKFSANRYTRNRSSKSVPTYDNIQQQNYINQVTNINKWKRTRGRT